jgi:hypothetical protein
MATPLPAPSEVFLAIDVYLRHAYPGEPPFFVRSQLNALRARESDLFKCPVLIADAVNPTGKFLMRLGNAHYPHMKLKIELSPNDEQFLYRVDTHDKHICPASSSPDYPAFCQLMEKNQAMASAIELDWERVGLPTFKTFLREDLKRRQASSSGSPR